MKTVDAELRMHAPVAIKQNVMLLLMLVHNRQVKSHGQRQSRASAENPQRRGLRDNLPWNISQRARSDWHCEMAIENNVSIP